jgi:uncharacterized protein Yka (UPF0111/DUF47 family)
MMVCRPDSVLRGKKSYSELRDLVKKYAEGPWEKCEEYAHEVMKSEDEGLFESLKILPV